MNNKPTFFQNVVGMFKDPDISFRDKALLVAGAFYLVSPVDIIPDMLFLIGWTDDAAVLYGTYKLFRKIYKRHTRGNGYNSRIVSDQSYTSSKR